MVEPVDDLLAQFLAGSKRAAARLISIVEDHRPEADTILDRLFSRMGRAARIGITGPPGAGKSTLVDQLAQLWVGQGASLGVVAVDPTSPFTGGALLGDRIRMGNVAQDTRLFFRSLATRGSLGGLSLHTTEVADVLDAFGCDRLLIETVGVGQSELDVASKAHTTVVVLVPESGDGIQAMKAGLMEIADLFVINKADRPGAEQLVAEIQSTLEMRGEQAWKPPVLMARAREGAGIPELAAALDTHRDWLVASGTMTRRKRTALESRVRDLVQDRSLRLAFESEAARRRLDAGLESILAGASTPYRLAEEITAALTGTAVAVSSTSPAKG